MPAEPIEDLQRSRPRRWRLLGVIAAVAAAVALLFALASTRSVFGPPTREGPVALVASGGGRELWVLLKREERRQRRIGTGRYSSGTLLWETFHHFDLAVHDPSTARRLRTQRLLTLQDRAGGYNARARILGQDGERVWLFLNDGPLALSARDGTRLGDRADIERQNPALGGLIPVEPDFYTWHEGLVITAADARHYRLRAPDFTASVFDPPDPDVFRRAVFMSTQWNGGYKTQDFQVRSATLGSRWIGLHSPREAADVADDEWGDKLRDPDRAWDEGALARRTLWDARIETHQPWPDRRAYDRIVALEPLPGAGDFLQGGFLIRAGTRVPLTLDDPAGLIVVHRTRVDEQGRLALTRLDEDLRVHWQVELPLTELFNRWELGDHLLLYGSGPASGPGPSRSVELLVVLQLRDGSVMTSSLRDEPDPEATP